MDIKLNRTLKRKATYIPSVFRDDKKEEHISDLIRHITIYKHHNKISNNFGIYLKPNEFDIYIDNYKSIKRNIQINSNNRNYDFFLSPFKFITYVGNNNVISDGVNEIYVAPRIQNIIPNISTINLNKIIIPNNFTINETNIINNVNYIEIKNLIPTINQLLNKNQLQIDSSYLINNSIVTIVNFVNNKKLNFIINYDPKNVYSFLINNNQINNTSIFLYNINYSNTYKNQRIYNLVVKELDDRFDYETNNSASSATFKLYPSSIKNKFLYADSKNIKKVYDTNPVKLNKLSISLLDNNFNELKLNFLDNDVNSNTNKCECNNESKKYSCSCNYILHPLNPNYQIYILFDFIYKQMTNYDTHI